MTDAIPNSGVELSRPGAAFHGSARFRRGLAVFVLFSAITVTSITTEPATAGNVIPVLPGDGYANASPGPAQLPDLLRAYTARPAWHVAGVDYAVGVPRGTVLRDPLTLSQPGVVIDPVHHLIRVIGSHVELDGYDFGLHGGWGVYVQSGARDTVITHSRFRVGANDQVPISTASEAVNLSVLSNTFDGGVAQGRGQSGAVWGLINFNGSGHFLAQYNWLGPAPVDAIDLNNGDVTVTVQYNVATNLGHASGSHPDFVQFVGSRVKGGVIAFNTIFQPPDAGEEPGMQGIQIEAQRGAHPSFIADMLVANNTIIAPGPELSMSCAVAVIEDTGNVIDHIVVHSNYLDFRGTYFPFYEPSGTNVTFSGNTDMTTGKQVTAPPPRKPIR